MSLRSRQAETAAQAPSGPRAQLAPLVIPLLILGVPIVDTAFSFLRRVLRGHSFSVADKDHLHHRLMIWPRHQKKRKRKQVEKMCR